MISKRHTFQRYFYVERWHIAAAFRWYYGMGLPQFDFAFRLGRPSRDDDPWPPTPQEPV